MSHDSKHQANGTSTVTPSTDSPPSTLNNDSVADLIIRKDSLRRSLRATLGAIPPTELLKLSRLTIDRILTHPAYRSSQSMCLFLSMPTGEIQTDELIQDALQAGKKVFVPRIEKKRNNTIESNTSSTSATPSASNMQLLQVQSSKDLLSFKPNRWQIREPDLIDANGAPRLEAGDCPELDLVLCPGLGFDSSRRRLGHGKGYYDKWLTDMRSKRAARGLTKPVRLIGIGLDDQLVDVVPTGVNDVPLDEVITNSKHFTQKD